MDGDRWVRKVRDHLCLTCGCNDPQAFYRGSKGKCKKCYIQTRLEQKRTLSENRKNGCEASKVMERKRKPHLCKVCGCKDPQEFYSNSKGECKKCALNRLRDEENIFRYRFLSARARATKHGIAFDIDEKFLEQVWNEQGGLCFYTKEPMTWQRDRRYSSMSIDRKDNKKGYTRDNVVLCCSQVNTMKSTLTIAELIYWCKAVAANSYETADERQPQLAKEDRAREHARRLMVQDAASEYQAAWQDAEDRFTNLKKIIEAACRFCNACEAE